MFTDDIETIELLLAHAIPEGIANLLIPVIVILAMFFVDWKLALLCIAALPIGMFAMGMMFKAGMAKMEPYYAAGAKMNNTIIEYINGMEVVKVFNRDGESYARFENDITSYRVSHWRGIRSAGRGWRCIPASFPVWHCLLCRSAAGSSSWGGARWRISF